MSRIKLFSSLNTKLRPLLLGLCLPLAYQPASVWADAPAINELQQLSISGAPGLALRLLDSGQPSLKEDIASWVLYERQRLQLLDSGRRWDEIIRRTDSLQSQGLPAAFVEWASLRRGRALLKTGQNVQARRLAVTWLWRSADVPAEDMAAWRRLVVQAYLDEGRVREAYQSLLRYRQDYGDENQAFRLLRARVLIRQGAGNRALLDLEDVDGPESRLLSLMARLEIEGSDAADIYQQARTLARDEDFLDEFRPGAWIVAARSAEAAGDLSAAVVAWESAATGIRLQAWQDDLLALDGDLLWAAYKRIGEQVANRQQLLTGDDRAWLHNAEFLLQMDAGLGRALMAALIKNGMTPEAVAQAHEGLSTSLLTGEGAAEVLRQLYLQSGDADISMLSETVRHRLVEQALNEADIRLASRLMAEQETAPEGKDGREWRLLRARVLILGGKYDQGGAELSSLVEQSDSWNESMRDRMLQVIFDLQTVGQDDIALDLFRALLKQELDPKLERELLFWTADSFVALQKYAQAARYYLRSATFVDGFGTDPWGQTARFKAAEALASAGLVEDARSLYQSLLRITKAAERRAVIERELQQLWLLEGRRENKG